MNEPERKTPGEAPADDRLEWMLRRWGADEAMEQTSPGELSMLLDDEGQAPLARPHGDARRAVLWRWVPVAAALVLFVGAAALFTASGLRMAAAPLAKQESTEMEQLLTSQLALAAERAEQAEAALAQLRQQRAELEATVTRAQNQVREALAAAKGAAAQQGSLRQQVADLRRLTDSSAGALTEAGIRLAAAEKAQAEAVARETAARRELGASVASLQARLDEATQQLRGAEARYALVLAYAGRRGEAASAGATARAATDIGPSLAAAQRMTKQLQLQARGEALARAAAADASLKELLGSVEVILTQLEMADPSDRQAGASLAAIMARTQAVARLGAMAERRDLAAETRTWLLECRLVLAGVSDAA